jgi:hypothetical protein
MSLVYLQIESGENKIGKLILNLNSVNQLIFVKVKYGVLFEVRAGFLNNI